MKLLAIDPSSTESGFAVLEDEELVDYGVVSTAKVPYDHRFMFITTALTALISKYGFTEVACERAFKSPKHNTAALQVSVMSIKKWAERYRLPISFYSSGEWKYSVVGHGNADKQAVARVVHLHFKDLKENVSQHVTDALGIGLHHQGVMKIRSLSSSD